MDINTMILEGALQNAQHQDDKIRSVAEGKLKQLQDENLANFFLSLSAVLSGDKSPPECRRLAGIILKDSLDGRYSTDGDILMSQWISVDQHIKAKIKESLLVTLGSLVPDARHASSQVIGKIAYIEIPRREWSDLIRKLLSNMAQLGASLPLKQGTLEALGYVFEEILGLDPDEVNDVLNAVIQAMNQTELSSEVRLAAVKALQSVLKHSNFANDNCRNLIMSAICDTAESDESKIKLEAFGCLVVIASKYCTMLEPYMETIFSLTTEALKGGWESGALQCIEFWITICEKVLELPKQIKHFANAISTADCRFIEKPLSSLVPVLLDTLLNQERDDDAQNIAMSGMTCLSLVARTIGDAVIPLVMQFVEGNIKASDWQSRKAATSALGIILEGPSIENLAPVVCLLMDRMEDPNMEVRHTAACTLGRVFELLHSPALGSRIFTNEDLPSIMAVLVKSSQDVPEVSEKVCGALYFLAQGYQSISSEVDHLENNVSSEISPFVGAVIDALFYASELKETPFRLPTSESAYEALSEVVRVSNMQDYGPSVAIRVLMPRIMRRLNIVLDIEASSSGDKRNKYDLLVLLCGILHDIIQKLGKSGAASIVTDSAGYVLLMFCRVLTCKCSTARDKAALAIGALVDATGPDFVDHMPAFLQYFNVKQLFPIYLQVIGSIFHVSGERILPYCDDIMDVLYKGLSKSKLKPAILECFGVIALATGKNFEKYLQAVMKKLKEAASPRYYVNVFDEDKVDYGNQLRQAIFKAYSGLLRGIKDPKSGLKVATDLFEFTEAVCKDQRRGTIVTAIAVDVLSEFGPTVESWTKGLISEVNKQ